MNLADPLPAVSNTVLYVPIDADAPEASKGVSVVAGIVVRVLSGPQFLFSEIDITVFACGLNNHRMEVPHSTAKEPGTWHWPNE